MNRKLPIAAAAVAAIALGIGVASANTNDPAPEPKTEIQTTSEDTITSLDGPFDDDIEDVLPPFDGTDPELDPDFDIDPDMNIDPELDVDPDIDPDMDIDPDFNVDPDIDIDSETAPIVEDSFDETPDDALALIGGPVAEAIRWAEANGRTAVVVGEGEPTTLALDPGRLIVFVADSAPDTVLDIHLG